ncbi:GNAT family N-acetyltransferase [Azospirillum formosense]|uniref:GNAT family N-acetyltransferase n=1 Tax=Azospirillum formosense TaxID=861533 RepID=A0ABX2KYQ2_9PROT|nr:GNAT family N-acetyltransferase [Azospirillum formosense]MBY3753287.1 GNAT family N-acetyltransferase [Azospirillum formosense]NUB20748.1 GNAT family N-acetyltransferase [Azospirillum formosense]
MNAGWRAMELADLDRVMAIAEVVHPDYPEDRAVFAERLALYPEGCAMAEADGIGIGYIVMHPGRLGVPPPLDSPLGALPESPDCLYLHDVALLPAARGLGLGVAALERMDALAARQGFRWLALTSTPGARAFWDAQGFVPRDGGAGLAAKLASYGGGMTYMTKPVAG